MAIALAAFGLAAQALDLQGHRGARGLAPENTLPAFAEALKHGVTTLELDVGVTRDGVVVIHHDLAPNPAIARDEQGRWLDQPGPPIHHRTWAELQRLDVGRLKPDAPYGKPFADQVPMDGTRIPRLADLFDMVRKGGHERVRFDIETKLDPRRPGDTPEPEAFVRAVLDVIRQAGMADRVTLQSFDWRTLQVAQRLAPGIPTAYLTPQLKGRDLASVSGGHAMWTAGFDVRIHGSAAKAIKAAGGRVWSAHQADIDASSVREAKGLGLQVLVWTVNDPAEMERVIDAGVDGIITDRPDVAQRVLRARGITPRVD